MSGQYPPVRNLHIVQGRVPLAIEATLAIAERSVGVDVFRYSHLGGDISRVGRTVIELIGKLVAGHSVL